MTIREMCKLAVKPGSCMPIDDWRRVARAYLECERDADRWRALCGATGPGRCEEIGVYRDCDQVMPDELTAIIDAYIAREGWDEQG